MKYLVVVEQGPSSFGAYMPDLPGCVAVGSTRAEVMELIQDAIEMHVEDLRDKGGSVPPVRSTGELVDVHA